ncbi:MAG: hypothetical protein R3B70_29790 [Polyangiaceae bacterium]
MAVARYRPDNDVTFDLANGLVHLAGAQARVLVPAEALAALCGAAGSEAVGAFGAALGQAMGQRVGARLSAASGDASESGAGARAASVETVVDHLGAELSLAGLGSLSIERWGHALVVVVDHCPLGAGGDVLLEAAVGEAVAATAARPVHAVFLARDGVRARLLLTSGPVAERVREWLRGGATWGEALTRLHATPAQGAQPS